MDSQHAQIFVEGKVQGVYFRASTKKEATRLGLSGFVKNLPDGRVYVEASGKSTNLKSLIEWCHKGPENAMVSKVTVQWTERTVFHDGFIIEY